MLAAIGLVLPVACGAPHAISAQTPGIGDVVSGDNWKIRVVSARKDVSLPKVATSDGEKKIPHLRTDAPGYVAEDGYSFLTVMYQLVSTSSGERSFSADSFVLIDGRKNTYVPVGMATKRLGDIVAQSGLIYVLVSKPGTYSVRGPAELPESAAGVVFLMPTGAARLLFKFRDLQAIALGM
jgi:hypothetical protein